MRLLAVDDELPALEDLARLLRATPGVTEVQTAASAAEALLVLGDGRAPDAVFSDVRMPGLDGLELARVLRRFEHPPAIVFVTAHDDFAVDAFEVAAVDYLLKPVSRARLAQAVERVGRRGSGEPATTGPDDVLPVELPDGGTRLLPRASIRVLRAHGDYVRVLADDGRFLVRAVLSELEERWAAHDFTRVHRSFVVNLRRAAEIRPQPNGTAVLVMDDGTEVPIARRLLGDLRRRLAR